jgi:5-amino-6-(5-phospho-D-ribitylamino)uracil phosphatase
VSLYKLLALDIDGTVLNSRGEVSPRVASAIAGARHAGMLVTLATGRSLRAALPVAQALQITAPLVVSNGALVIAPASGRVLLKRVLPATIATRAVQLLQRLGFTTFARRYCASGPDLFYEQGPAAAEQACLLGQERDAVRQVFDLAGAVATMEPLKVMTLDRTPAIEAAAAHLAGHMQGAYSLLITREMPGYSLLEVSACGVSKATGLERLTALNSIHPHEVVAFGDNFNDLEMLQFAGLGVAMGNAPDPVKQAARVITASNDEDGVAQVLEQYILQVA